MKKFIIYIVCALLCWGCEKDPSTKTPVIKNVIVTNITDYGATCTFTLDPVGSGVKAGVIYGNDPEFQSVIYEVSTVNVSSGNISIELYLQGNTLYYYKAYVSNEQGESFYSEIGQFWTNYMSLSTSSLSFLSSGEQKTIDITSNVGYEVRSTASWLTVSPSSGSNNGTINITATAYESETYRTANILISSDGLTTKTINVNQAGFPFELTLSTYSLNILSSGEQKTFDIASNTNYTVSCDASWLTISPTSGSNNGTVNVTVLTNTGSNQRTATITVSVAGLERTISVTQEGAPVSDEGIIINNVKWATRNIAAPGTFTSKSENVGMLYQWNRSIGWSAISPMMNSNGGVTWDNTTPTGARWEKSNDPSPSGWRVPTLDEIQSLLDTDKVSNEWASVNGVNGRKFTDKSTGNSLFLPTAGYRNNVDGALFLTSSYGYYWSSMQSGSDQAYYLVISANGTNWSNFSRSVGFSLRCVAD